MAPVSSCRLTPNYPKMHILQPKHVKLKSEDAEKLLDELNISLVQLPKIRITDPALPEGCEISDIVRIERISDNKKSTHFRTVSI